MVPRPLLVDAARAELADLRAHIKREGGAPPGVDQLAARVAARALADQRPEPRRVLNATGVVLHTNLGRAPLSRSAREALDLVARGYSNLEFDLVSGRRGERGLGVERWLKRLTGAEAALAVFVGSAPQPGTSRVQT